MKRRYSPDRYRCHLAENSLKGQPALVTGANSGIGCAVAKALAAAGAPVVVNYFADPPAAERVDDEIRNAGGEAMAIRADVCREDEVQAMFRKMFDDRAFTAADVRRR